MTLKVCVIIPAYNAENTIISVIDGCLRYLDHESVFVIDDGSSDSTWQLAKGRGIQVSVHRENRGKGAALRTGYVRALESGYEAIITMDADMQHDMSSIPDFIKAAESNPDTGIIVGAVSAAKAICRLIVASRTR